MRILCAGLLLLLLTAFSVAGVRALSRYPIGVCYATDGTTIETTYINPAAASYPIHSEGTVTQTDIGYAVEHRVVFVRLGNRVYLTGVTRD